MKALIVGGAGTLGSHLSDMLLADGHEVTVLDSVRVDEAWKLHHILDKIKYNWKSVHDVNREDVQGFDVMFDGAAMADRPFGIESPSTTIQQNIVGTARLLEAVRRVEKPPVCIYPSSFNIFYAVPGLHIKEDTQPVPSSVYGYSKAAAEMLYTTYNAAYNVPTIVTRVGSAFGPRMRSDELLGRLCIYFLQNKDFYLRSPQAKRLWTYGADVMEAYKKILDDPQKHSGSVLHIAGNKGDRIVTNMELAEMVKRLTGSTANITEGHYEHGEIINGKPVEFTMDSSLTRKKLGWEPKWHLEDSIKELIVWKRDNLWRYHHKKV